MAINLILPDWRPPPDDGGPVPANDPLQTGYSVTPMDGGRVIDDPTDPTRATLGEPIDDELQT